jgi:hypothetical protein
MALSFRPWDPANPADPRLPPPPPEDPLDPIFTDDTLFTLIQALPAGATDPADRKLRRKVAAMHLLRSLDAQQPVEAALATLAVLFHYNAVDALRSAARSPQPTETSAGNQTARAGRASTLFCRLLNELARKQDQPPNLLPSLGKPRWRR